jgi:predicted metalloprotease with PDZ domain
LEALERIAADAEDDEWEWSDGALRGKHNGQVVAYATESNSSYDASIVIGASDKAHIAASSPPVVLALISRIRELEAALFDAQTLCRNHGHVFNEKRFAEILAAGAVVS